MRTCFMCSIGNEAILKALFKVKEDELTFANAISVAVEIEEAAKVVKETVYEMNTSFHKVKSKRWSLSPEPDEHIKQQMWIKGREFPTGTYP